MKCVIIFEYDNESDAEIVSKVLEIDNKVAPRKLKVISKRIGNKVINYIEHESFKTFFATVEDLIFTERLISRIISIFKKESDG